MMETQFVSANRVRTLGLSNAGIPDPHPGTPDDRVSKHRLLGRLAYRSGKRYVRSVELPVLDCDRVEFWNGYYDEQWACLFGRGNKSEGVSP